MMNFVRLLFALMFFRVIGARILPESRPVPVSSVQIQWVDAESLSIGGRAFNQTSGVAYTRLPAQAQSDVPDAVWQASRLSSGVFVQFGTDASSIHLNYTLLNANWTQEPSFPPNGYSGCDLYQFDKKFGDWRWVATTFVGLSSKGAGTVVVESPLFSNAAGWPAGPLPPYPTLNATFHYRIHLPSFNGVVSVQVGVPAGATITGSEVGRGPVSPVVFYGTRITQGALTGRPGQTYVSTVGRYLNLDVFNFGFAGGCVMDPGVGKWLGQLATPIYVIDCGWDMPPALIAQRAEPFVEQLRMAQPAAAIVLVEPTAFRPSWILGDLFNITGRRAELRAAYERLVAAGTKQLFYVTGDFLLEDALEDPSYDGEQPLDYGHRLMAERLSEALAPIVSHRTVANVVFDRGAFELEPNVIGRRSAPAQATPAASAATQQQEQSVIYTDATQLTIRGRAFNDTPSPYNRLPAAAQSDVRAAVWELSLNSPGLLVAFRTDSPSVYVNYTAANAFGPMVHFPVSGVSGLDLFSLAETASPAVYRFVATVEPTFGAHSFVGAVVQNMTALGKPRSFVLYLPPYNNPVTLQVGVLSGSVLLPDEPFPDKKAPIVWYGTSILQGGVTFKAANIFTNVISRALSREIFNFGFSGNGKMELSVAKYLATIPNPAVVIIDCVWNMDPALISSNAQPLVKFLRQAQPTTPFVLVEGDPFGNNWAVPASLQLQQADNAALRAAFDALVAAGDKNLYYVNSSQLFIGVNAFDTPTNAGLHPTDGGMQDVARFWTAFLPTIMSS
eukprot:TRINITY_DN6627_c0_g1_i2.p1 TRINITY_DN6627_c0_g1~~TRINITY_DN6627_c0_g1_i2.p1  ORF type:complete len:786 (+),score=243.87 TRINITY_DN6627_c0_g1_i2:197-2554(+)